MKSGPETATYSGSNRGFTLMEVLLAAVFLGLLATGVTAVYSSGFHAQEYQIERMYLDSRMQSRMEILLSTAFQSLEDGSENVTLDGKVYTLTWNIGPVDLNGDGINETSAKNVTVTVSGMAGLSVSTIITDHENRIGKIS